MSVLSDMEKKLGIVETDVIKFFTTTLPNFEQKVATEVEAAANWFDTKALPWMGAHGQEIAADVVGLLGIAAAANLGIPEPLFIAAKDLNYATSLVNTAIAAQQQAAVTGQGSVGQAIAAGAAAYTALKQVQISTANAQVAVVTGK